MAYKTTRNRALADRWRLITAKEEGGTTWYSPDGHFATTFPIYDGYHVKKGQEVPTTEPNMSMVIDKFAGDEYLTATVVGDGIDNQGTHYVEFRDDETRSQSIREVVDERYYNLFRELYPNAIYAVSNNHADYPIIISDNGVLVGMIMPLKSQRK